ncbi:hypothetical protein Pth03_79310 [Planotetraspora thailandica]|uniref:Uncharacterized protein n=1 Tax=Planotetraspora thailandica TaxID=487172 RepID=A0A8J3Y292_9ACTN|nr:hypothetical protein [Planotetraspora thailandica]GII59542.1 hypothetical protein Pth03_79310 [Planotetraspora thailandica]
MSGRPSWETSLCAIATGLEAAASPGEIDVPRDFSVCVTDAGVLASFTGTLTSGEKDSIQLVKFTGEADPAAFEAPAGAEIVDAGSLPTS